MKTLSFRFSAFLMVSFVGLSALGRPAQAACDDALNQPPPFVDGAFRQRVLGLKGFLRVERARNLIATERQVLPSELSGTEGYLLDPTTQIVPDVPNAIIPQIRLFQNAKGVYLVDVRPPNDPDAQKALRKFHISTDGEWVAMRVGYTTLTIWKKLPNYHFQLAHALAVPSNVELLWNPTALEAPSTLLMTKKTENKFLFWKLDPITGQQVQVLPQTDEQIEKIFWNADGAQLFAFRKDSSGTPRLAVISGNDPEVWVYLPENTIDVARTQIPGQVALLQKPQGSVFSKTQEVHVGNWNFPMETFRRYVLPRRMSRLNWFAFTESKDRMERVTQKIKVVGKKWWGGPFTLEFDRKTDLD